MNKPADGFNLMADHYFICEKFLTLPTMLNKIYKKQRPIHSPSESVHQLAMQIDWNGNFLIKAQSKKPIK